MRNALAWSVGGFFLVYGAAFALFPVLLATFVTGTAPDTSSGLIELRATGGGLAIAVGATICWLTRTREGLADALWVSGVVLLCMATARSLGIVLDGDPNAIMVLYLVLEILFGGWALLMRRSIVTRHS